MSMRIPFAILLLSFMTTSLAEPPPSIATEEWVTRMEAIMPDLLCEESTYFAQCFELADGQCHSTLSTTFQACMAIYLDHLPERITSSAEGAHWGQMIGSCAGTKFDMQMAELKIQSPRCNDPTQW